MVSATLCSMLSSSFWADGALTIPNFVAMIGWSRTSRPFEEDMCFLETLFQWSKVVGQSMLEGRYTCCDLLHAGTVGPWVGQS